jgi:hypothetical protein
MTASVHHDLWWPDSALEYYFDCLVPPNGPDSGWISEREFAVSGLAPATYQYVVRVRDGRGNVTADSVSATVTPGENTELPAAQWLNEPFVKDTQLAIEMEALAYEDFGTIDVTVPTLPAGYVIRYQYEYTGTASGGDGRLYDLDPVYVDTGMEEGLTYSYRVRMGLFYEPGDGSSVKIKDGPWSLEASIVASGPDLTPPDPDPAEHASGSPFQTFVASKGIYYHIITAVTATDESDVEYRFINTTNSSYSSGGSMDPDGIMWRNADNVADLTYPNGEAQTPEQYWAPRGIINASDGWYILVRDRSPNQNTTVKSQTRTIFTPAP